MKNIHRISVEVHENNNTKSINELVDLFNENNFKVETSSLVDESTMKLSMLYAENKEFKKY
jgi:hypothetical protein